MPPTFSFGFFQEDFAYSMCSFVLLQENFFELGTFQQVIWRMLDIYG